jgi:hypothetical protein
VTVIGRLVFSSTKKQLHAAGRTMKIVMITGILYSVVVKMILMLNLVG